MNADMAGTSAEVTQFLLHEAQLLDEARYDEWLALFLETAWYWVPSQPNQVSPRDTVSLIYDDRRLLEARVRRLGNLNLHAQQPPARASHIVANVTTSRSPSPAAALLARSKHLMVEFRRNRQRLFAATCHHELVRRGGEFNIPKTSPTVVFATDPGWRRSGGRIRAPISWRPPRYRNGSTSRRPMPRTKRPCRRSGLPEPR